MLRLATSEDYELVSELVKELIADSKYSLMLSGFELTQELYSFFVSSKINRIVLLITNSKDEVIGITAFDKTPSIYTTVDVARIAIVYLKPECRGKGYMSEVFEALEYWAKKVNCKYVNVSVSKDNVDLTTRGYKQYEVVYMKEIE